MAELRYGDQFDPTTATREQIMDRAKVMQGKTLRNLGVRVRATKERPDGNKGLVGGLVEAFFNIKQNSESAPDFNQAGIELKAVPLKAITRPKHALRVKERTSVTMINYADLVTEKWASASVRKKITAVLFIYYRHLVGGDPLDSPIENVILWEPGPELMHRLETDWTIVRDKVAEGLAHQVSERDGRLLGAATKDSSGRDVPQPRSSIPARRRAWSLKPALTSWIRDSRVLGGKEESIALALKLSPKDDFEDAVHARLEEFVGIEFGEIAKRIGATASPEAKHWEAIVVRRILGIVNNKARVREFAQYGIEVKTVPVSADGRSIFEHMSFPQFDHSEIGLERWETSAFRGYIERLLIVPTVRRSKGEARVRHRLGHSFFWSPTEEQLAQIGEEWDRSVALIRDQRVGDVPKASSTHFIHVRTKGKNNRDTEPGPGNDAVTRKSFWLNKEFILSLISQNLPGGVL